MLVFDIGWRRRMQAWFAALGKNRVMLARTRPRTNYTGVWQEPDAMLPMTDSTWGKPENWIGYACTSHPLIGSPHAHTNCDARNEADAWCDRSQEGGGFMSLMTAYEGNPYGVDLNRAHYQPIATLLPRIACPQCGD